MKRFKQHLTEALDPNDFENKAKKSASLFLGRLQPLHNGHQAIIKMMKNPVVVLVKGKKSSEDKARNPFDEKYQSKLIKLINPKVKVMTAPTGYIPDIINMLRKDGIEINEVLSGDDRIAGYQKQITSFNKQMPVEKQISTVFTKTKRISSATIVRNAITEDDFETFKENVPKKLWKEFETMKKIMGV